MVRRTIAGLVCVCLMAVGALAARAENNAIIILDASNSMWGQIEGRHKIEIAREVMQGVIRDWEPSTQLGLVVYGHRRRGDCSDIQTVIPVGPVEAEQFLNTVDGIQPRGKTPLTDAVAHAAEELGYVEEPATVILVSDGIETCDRDPCSVAADLERRGIGFTAHVIGFDVTESADQAQLRCIADATGGRFLPASNADELQQALGQLAEDTTQQQVVEKPEREAASEVTVDAPDTAVAGSEFEVGWDPTLERRDYVTIVPAGAEDNARGNYFRVRDRERHNLRAPSEPGLYEVRYVSDANRTVLGRDAIEVVEAEVQLTAPESAAAGSEFAVGWSGSIHPRDYITIVPAGADDNARGNYFRVRDRERHNLRAPSEPGLYEVRYVLDEGKRVLASATIEITGTEVSVGAPETAVAGSDFEVTWSNAVHPRDYVTIVPSGADDNARGNYFRVRDRDGHTLRAPSEPGLYEVRYVLDEGKRVLASTTIEITGAEVSVNAPDTALAGSNFEVSYSNPVHPRDYITIVPAGADDNARGNYFRVRNDESRNLRAPSEPGVYEVRYVLDEGKRVLGRTTIEITDPEIVLSAPETARVDTEIRVSWTGDTPNARDYVTIVPAGAEDRARGEYGRVRGGSPVDLTTPSDTGLYEIRYVLDEGKRVLARTQIEIVSETASIDSGAGLQAPSSAAPGESIQVSWTLEAAGGDHRVTLARADQADFTWIEAQSAGDGPPLTFTAPKEPGLYEIRYIDIGGREVLGRVRLNVE